jgi:hypothetical protein
MPRAKKTSTAPTENTAATVSPAPAKKASPVVKTTEAQGKPVSSVNPQPANGGVKTNGDLEAAIRSRAYALYEERGRSDGRAHEDWIRAEREILQQHGQRRSA